MALKAQAPIVPVADPGRTRRHAARQPDHPAGRASASASASRSRRAGMTHGRSRRAHRAGPRTDRAPAGRRAGGRLTTPAQEPQAKSLGCTAQCPRLACSRVVALAQTPSRRRHSRPSAPRPTTSASTSLRRRDGAPITDLTQADFEILEGGVAAADRAVRARRRSSAAGPQDTRDRAEHRSRIAGDGAELARAPVRRVSRHLPRRRRRLARASASRSSTRSTG